jgi:HSP20 family protein
MAHPTSALSAARRPWGGLASLVDLHREMNRVFDDLFFNGGALMASPFTLAQNASTPLLDVQDKDDEVCVRADMPGVAPADLDVRIEDDMLTMTGERRQEGADGGARERGVGRFQHAVRLPFAPDPEQVRAELANGVVTVHLPRRPEQARSRRIEVRAAGDGAQGGDGRRAIGQAAEAPGAGPQAGGDGGAGARAAEASGGGMPSTMSNAEPHAGAGVAGEASADAASDR